MYLDTSYIAKFYIDEPESAGVRELFRKADFMQSSVLAFAEFHAVLHRGIREGALSADNARRLSERFSGHVADGTWKLATVSESLLRRTSALLLSAPPDLFIRTSDAIHLTTAQDIGEHEIWTSDRHMLAAASYFGLKGRRL
ncbi:MAG TPA: type II toxin-antitoxin system VapC family toxin [Bryobacteraceae bacterium]|nr:type II toxin-antitoxin system VapC family toxin [Bryobacteraceae bacterium]